MTDTTDQTEELTEEEKDELTQDMLAAHAFCGYLPKEATNAFVSLSIIGILVSYRIPHEQGKQLLEKLAERYAEIDLDPDDENDDAEQDNT